MLIGKFIKYTSAIVFVLFTQDVIAETRIERLEHLLKLQADLNKIPGIAIVIVKDGETLLSKGFGFKDIEKGVPVTKNTVFPINSLSKPITSILAGIRVDEKAINWDDKLADYLPTYSFNYLNEKVPITLRDALSHRTSYGRNDALWSNSQITRSEIIKAAPLATPVSVYGEQFNYNNVMYLAAGMATAHDYNFDWDTMLAKKLLKPLGMTSTSTNHAKVTQSGRLASGYYFSEIEQRHIKVAHKDRSNIAPATGIYSTATDMEKLLKFLLSDKNETGYSIIKPATLTEIFKPTSRVSPTFSYGLGWYVSEYNDETLLDHSGNGEGFSSVMALLPDSNTGFVILMNTTITPFQTTSINLIFDALTKEASNDTTKTADVDYSKFIGDYQANFWQFENVSFSFQMHGNKPAINIPGQTTYMLKPPNADGKFLFELTDKVAVSFNYDKKGNVVSMTHHEEGQQFILPRKVESAESKKAAFTLSKKAADKLFNITQLQSQKVQYEGLGNIELQGSLIQKQSGVTGHFKLVLHKEAWHLTQDLGKYGYLETKVSDNGGFNKRLRHEYQLKSNLLKQAYREHPLNFLYWDQLYETVKLSPPKLENNELKATLDSAYLTSVNASINTSSGLVERISMQFIDPVWGTYPRSITYADYRLYCGLYMPMEFAIDDHETGITTFEVTSLTSENCPNANSAVSEK